MVGSLFEEKKLGLPGSYKEVFSFLAREKIISSELSEELQSLVNKRNVLAHEYFDVTKRSIFMISVKMKAVKDFLAVIRALITKENGKKSKK